MKCGKKKFGAIFGKIIGLILFAEQEMENWDFSKFKKQKVR
jgi:hypothetical protein